MVKILCNFAVAFSAGVIEFLSIQLTLLPNVEKNSAF